MLKKLLSVILLISNFVWANIYSSGIKISDDTVSLYKNANNQWSGDFTKTKLKIWFILNEAGSSQAYVEVSVMDGNTTVAKITKTGLQAGENFVIWDGKDNNGNYVAAKTYKFKILAKDPVGHTSVDSLWVVGANRNGGVDLDGATTFPYRGASAYHNQNLAQFGNILIARGTNSGINGAWRLRADGTYLDKIIQVPYQATLTNRYFEIVALDNNVFLFPGHSYSSIGRNYKPDGTQIDTFNFKYKNARGFSVQVTQTDTNIIFGCMETTRFGLMKFKYHGTDTSLFINMRDLNPSGAGYIIATAFDDEGNIYVAYGKTSEARKRLAKYDKNGTLVWNKALDTDWGLTASGTSYPLFSSLAIYHGKNKQSASDDKLYAYIFGAPGESGIYEIKLDGSNITKLITPAGFSNSTTSQKIAIDPAGNIIYSNGSSIERIMLISPADGYNEFTTQNPSGTDVVVNKVPAQTKQLHFYETFEYIKGANLTSHGYYAHSGAGQNPLKVVDTNLTYKKYASVPKGYATITQSGSGTREDVRKFFKGISQGKLYVSFLFNVQTAAEDLADYNLHFSDSSNSSTTFKGRFFVKKDKTTKKLSFAIGESQGSSSITFPAASFDTGKTYLALMMIDLDKPYKPNYLWINPDLSKDPDTTKAYHKILANTNYSFKYASICFRQGGVKNNTIFDEIKVTDDFELLKLPADTTITPPTIDTVYSSIDENFENIVAPALPKNWKGLRVKVFNDGYGLNGSKQYAGWYADTVKTHWLQTPKVAKPKFVRYFIAGFSNQDQFTVYFQKSSNGTNWINIDTITAPPLGFNFVKKEYNINASSNDTLTFRWYCENPIKNGFFIDSVMIGDKPEVDTTYMVIKENFENVVAPNLPKHWKGLRVKVYDDGYGLNGSKQYAGWYADSVKTHWLQTPKVEKPQFVRYFIAGFSNQDQFTVYFQKSADGKTWIDLDTVTAPPLGFNFVKREITLNSPVDLKFRWYCPDPVKNGFFVDSVYIGKTPVVGNENIGLPLSYELYQNYPNPFNPTTVIKFAVPAEQFVEVKLFNILGQEVATIVSDKLKAGYYTFNYNAGHLSSGVYICHMKAGNFRKSIKMMLIK